jgi:hypothetical protein
MAAIPITSTYGNDAAQEKYKMLCDAIENLLSSSKRYCGVNKHLFCCFLYFFYFMYLWQYGDTIFTDA